MSSDERRGAAAPASSLLAPATLDVSIVIVNYNTAGHLEACLRSLERTDANADEQRWSRETWVVDNASPDRSADMVAAQFPWVRLIRSPINGGYAYANNLALRQCQGRFLLLLNPDTEVGPGDIARLIDYLEIHPEVGAVGPKLLRADGSLDLACRRSFPTPEIAFYRMMGLSGQFPRSRRFGRYNLTYLDPDLETEVDALAGACMLVRREAVEQAGLLDEAFFMYGEDIDWAYRIKELGWHIRYNPMVSILHHKGESSRRNSRRATIAFYHAMHLFYAKHYKATTFFLLGWLIVAAIYARLGWALLRDAASPAERRRVAT